METFTIDIARTGERGVEVVRKSDLDAMREQRDRLDVRLKKTREALMPFARLLPSEIGGKEFAYSFRGPAAEELGSFISAAIEALDADAHEIAAWYRERDRGGECGD